MLNKYIGITINGNACVLETTLTPKEIIERDTINKLYSHNFDHSATNWMGSDNLERTLKLEKLALDEKISLKLPIRITGEDSDMGHVYEWEIFVKEIFTTKPIDN